MTGSFLHAALAFAAAAPAAAAGEVTIRWEAPAFFLAGWPYVVEVAIEAPGDGADMPGWLLTPSAFTVDGEPVAERLDTATVHLPGGAELALRFDLGQYLSPERPFRLDYAEGVLDEEAAEVDLLRVAPEGLDFMEMPEARLGSYTVLLDTNRGPVHLELWPDVAPMHARNFLDLAYAGFYDGTLFHRVIPGFMIQGGDPTGTGSGRGPRTLEAEFSDVPHDRGVLSMARGNDPDSASCQFFICHADSHHLDNKYSAFGEVKSGMDTVDEIATTPRRGESPVDPQVVLRAVVIDGSR